MRRRYGMQFEERKKDHHLVLRRFFSLFSRLSNFTLFSNINQTNYQLASEPNQKAKKKKSLKGVYIHNSFSPSPKNAPTNPSLPPFLIKNRKSRFSLSRKSHSHSHSHYPKKRKKKRNSQPQLRLLIPPHIRLLSTPLTHLQTPPFALHDPCAETVMIGVVAGEMTMFDETAT